MNLLPCLGNYLLLRGLGMDVTDPQRRHAGGWSACRSGEGWMSDHPRVGRHFKSWVPSVRF